MKPPGMGRKVVISPRESCNERCVNASIELVGICRDHGGKAYRPHEHVDQEETEGTGMHERWCCSEEEPSTDDAPNTGNESQSQLGW